MTRRQHAPRFDSELVVSAYRSGFFPMAESRNGPISWYSPDPRAVIPLDAFNVPRSLRREMRRSSSSVTFDRSFGDVIAQCAERRFPEETWISDDIVRVYTELHARGIAHSVEIWLEGKLVGGLYGIALGGAFFGESMFSRVSGASKFALVSLVARLRERGYMLLDSQIINDHVRQFGAIEIPRDRYLSLLAEALSLPVSFHVKS
ncbi:MAG TPA: leucyl/phenylalanyl-tRNA--protein transferase [Bacteroidota bacterium]|nr:leucyl/phenylalanyl-tRNA--protein transferase [Bacteroidota bacterium]